ncbi:MAG: Crp/Fnr family transcriptional regulator [Bacteroidota bacterium]
MPFEQFKTHLQQVAYLTPEDCALFEPYLRSRALSKHDFLLRQGKVCRDIGFVEKGAFRVYYLQDGKEINTRFVFENDYVVDYGSFLHQTPSQYFIQSLEESKLVLFDQSALVDGYERSKNWERFGRQIAEKSFLLTTERVESFLFLDGEERYLQALRSYPTLFERVPLYHIASYLGMERESLSRLRRKIAERDRL